MITCLTSRPTNVGKRAPRRRPQEVRDDHVQVIGEDGFHFSGALPPVGTSTSACSGAPVPGLTHLRNHLNERLTLATSGQGPEIILPEIGGFPRAPNRLQHKKNNQFDQSATSWRSATATTSEVTRTPDDSWNSRQQTASMSTEEPAEAKSGEDDATKWGFAIERPVCKPSCHSAASKRPLTSGTQTQVRLIRTDMSQTGMMWRGVDNEDLQDLKEEAAELSKHRREAIKRTADWHRRCARSWRKQQIVNCMNTMKPTCSKDENSHSVDQEARRRNSLTQEIHAKKAPKSDKGERDAFSKMLFNTMTQSDHDTKIETSEAKSGLLSRPGAQGPAVLVTPDSEDAKKDETHHHPHHEKHRRNSKNNITFSKDIPDKKLDDGESEGNSPLVGAKLATVQSVVKRLSSLNLKKTSTKECRMKLLTKLRKVRMKQDKMKRLIEVRRIEFEKIPANERAMLQEVFSRFDSHGTLSLTSHECKRCLAALGLHGRTDAERQPINLLCKEAALVDRVNFLDFVLDLVPNARKVLGDARWKVNLKAFADLVKAHQEERGENVMMNVGLEEECTGSLELEDAITLAMDLFLCWNTLDQIGLKELHDHLSRYIIDIVKEAIREERRQQLRDMYGDELPEEEESTQEGESGSPKSQTSNPDASTSFRVLTPDTVLVDCNLFRQMCDQIQQQHSHLLAKREMEVVAGYELDRSWLGLPQSELLQLLGMFQRADLDHSGILDCHEVNGVLYEFGCGFEASEDTQVNFSDFLNLVEEVRGICMSQRQEELTKIFDKYDRDHSGELSVEELSPLLADLDMTPQNPEERDQLLLLVEYYDVDGTGEISFKEFECLYNRFVENKAAAQRRSEHKAAKKMGYDIKETDRIRGLFKKLDLDATGALGVKELHVAVGLLGLGSLSKAGFEMLFDEIDVDNDGQLDFDEFLKLLALIDSKKGVFDETAVKITKLDALDIDQLYEVLKAFRSITGATAPEELTWDELYNEVGSYLSPQLCANLPKTGATTFPEFLYLIRNDKLPGSTTNHSRRINKGRKKSVAGSKSLGSKSLERMKTQMC
eukprot:gnl/MRDRNA2_/MRDRNA2_100999_c0_seq1.p1 gnl/MRDRNA2_/MRDRNA2_100999_c0~~gnl/MRDRNA2_/MRDRNA2_100999_c0_seq1.p1  ORF type:complete len:1058 (-),score=200.87 gnl/MRDRNA2_/MRDRNA2_100999_c0_seq1:119-3292(-)